MTGTWYALRSLLRRRWLSYLLLALLLAGGGGASLAAVAAARRTVSAYPRYLRASNASDVAIDAQALVHPSVRRRIARLPGVLRASSYQAFYAAPVGADGQVDPSYDAEAIGSVDGRFFDQDRVVIVEGRLADTARAGEIVVSGIAAQLYHYKVGQRLRLAVTSEQHLNASFEHPKVDLYQWMTVVGIAKFNDEIVQDEIDRSPSILLTPAFTQAHLALGTYVWTGLQVKGGRRAVPAILNAVRHVGIDRPFVRIASDTIDQAQRSVRPLAWSLALFGFAAAVAVVVLAGQALVRQVRLDADDHPVLRAIGMRPTGIGAVELSGGLAATALGVVGAVGVAVALSPLSPVGPVRLVEPSPGLAVDALTLGAGAALLFVLVFLQPALAAWRLQRTRGKATEARPSRVVDALARSGAPTTSVVGARFALETGRGRTSLPTRTTLFSAVIAMVALTGALTWGSSLHSLVNEPRLYGWDWDATLFVSGGYGPDHGDNLKAFRSVLDKDRAVQDWAGMAFDSLVLDGKSVAAVGLVRGRGDIGPPLVGATGLGARDDIFLGQQTLKRLHKAVGDRVVLAVGATRRELHIAGEAVFPTLGVLHGDRVGLGSGALVDRSVLPPDKGGSAPGLGAVVVRFKPGANRSAAVGRLRDFGSRHPELVIDEVFTGPKRPADIVNFRQMGLAPTLMASLFGLVALCALANALVASVRRRRRDFALLKVLGVTRRQLSLAVAWQATITMGVALLVGVPLGVAIGRTLWTRFANAVGVVPRPTVPFLTLAFVAAGALVVANLIAALPGRSGSRTEAAVVLRSE